MAKDISESKGKKVQKDILTKEVEWQDCFREFVQKFASLSKAGYLDPESIGEIKIHITRL
jgi:hypothetical protein